MPTLHMQNAKCKMQCHGAVLQGRTLIRIETFLAEEAICAVGECECEWRMILNEQGFGLVYCGFDSLVNLLFLQRHLEVCGIRV